MNKTLLLLVAVLMVVGLGVAVYVGWLVKSNRDKPVSVQAPPATSTSPEPTLESTRQAARVDMTRWKEYANFGIRFKYPETVRIIGDKVVLTPVVVDGKTKPKFGWMNLVDADPNSNYLLTVRFNNASSLTNDFTLGKEKVKGSGFRTMRFKGKEAFEAYPDPECPDCARLFGVKLRDRAYYFEVLTINKSWPQNEPVIRAILSTVEFEPEWQDTAGRRTP